MITVVINGQSFDYPEIGDTEWGDAATNAFKALAATTLQKIGGDFTLQNDLVVKGGKGIYCLFFSSSNSDPSQSGVYRLCNGELVAWRNGNNDDDNSISFDASDNFVINGNTISFDVNGEMLVNGVQVTRSGEIVNADVAANAGIEESKLALNHGTTALYDNIENHKADTANPHSVTKTQVLTGDLIVNADVDASAAIVESKLSLDYSTSSLNSAITSHTGDTNNPHDTTIDNLDDTTITTPANDDTLLYDGSKWVNTPNTVDNLKNVSITSLQDKNILAYDNNDSLWKNIDNSVNNLAGVSVTTPVSGQVLTYDGSNWTNQASASASLAGLTDTTITSAADGDTLVYDSVSTKWINSDKLTTVDTNLTLHTSNTSNPHSTTVSNLDDTTITTPSDQDTIVYDNNSSKWINQENSINNLTNVSIDSNTLAVGDALVFDDQDSLWKNDASFTNHIGNTANPHLTTVAKLTDTTISTPANNDVLLYDYANSQWINSNIIEVNEVAYIGTTPQGHTIDANNRVTMVATDNKYQIITATDGYGIVLPSTGVKAGESFYFQWTKDFWQTATNPFYFIGSDLNTKKCTIWAEMFIYKFTAIVDNPTAASDWVRTYKLKNIYIKSFSGSHSYSISSSSPLNYTSSTLQSVPKGFYQVSLHFSNSAGGIAYPVIASLYVNGSKPTFDSAEYAEIQSVWNAPIAGGTYKAIINKSGLLQINSTFINSLSFHVELKSTVSESQTLTFNTETYMVGAYEGET